MSEETVISLVTPEVVVNKSTATTNSTVNPNTIVSPTPLKSDEKLLPRYLRPSTGSCHDICKYGIKRVCDAEERHPIFPSFLGNNQLPDGEYSQSNFMTLRQIRRQKSELKARITHTKDGLADKIKVIEQTDLPPEKIIHVSNSPTNLAEGSDHESSSLKHNAALHDQTNNASLEHSISDQDEKSVEESMDTVSDDHESAYPSDVAIEEQVPITQVGGSSGEHVRIKFIISSAMQESIASEYKDVDTSEFSAEHKSIELITTSPITNNIVSAECQIANGAEESSDKLVSTKMKTLPGSSEGPSSLVLKNHKNKASAKCRPVNRVEVASKESLGMKLKVPSIKKSTSSTVNKPTDRAGLSKVQIQVKSLSIGDKTKREVNKVKSGSEEIGVSDRHKDIQQEQDDLSSGVPNFVKKNFALSKTMKSVKLVTKQECPSYDKNTIASVRPRLLKKESLSPSKTIYASVGPATSSKINKHFVKSSSSISSTGLSPSKTIYASVVPATSLKINKHLVKSSSSISLTGLSGRRNHEKIIKESDKSNVAKDEVFEPLSNPPFTEPQFTQVSNMKLRKCRTPSFTVKNQAKAGKFGANKKILNATKTNPENVDLQTLKQKLRKHKSFPVRKEEQEKSGSKLSGVSEPIFHREATQRTYRDVPKIEMKSIPRRNTSVNSEDKIETPPKLNFSRGMRVNLHSENNTPARLRFKPAEVVGDNQNANGIQTKSFRNCMESDCAESNTSPLKAINVVLRHPDVHDKKETQNLFNHVIEETASKLVEARKSKVKALVGVRLRTVTLSRPLFVGNLMQ